MTFALSLWRAIRTGYDVIHVQDPWLAKMLDLLNRSGLSQPRVILAHGTEESDGDLQCFRYLQHLAPCYRDSWEARKAPGQRSFAIPNFVDTTLFRPGKRSEARTVWNLPPDALIVLSVAALKKHHKRCDYLIHEFARFQSWCGKPALLVMAGAREKQTSEIVELGSSLPKDSVLILESLDRARLPSLYQAADIFALASLHEMLPIAALEALASGLPITCNRTPVLEWVTGPAGAPQDISQAGGLAEQWQRMSDPRIRARFSSAARTHADQTFSEPVVLKQILNMYAAVMND
ncbi:MAG TPA: glycosyltransferase family 4 protein [Candidatus Acidoferrales bacterium]|jgi:glycosyltransferase involved in cell wall biosynthesis|nr:glycosyltransferase family 4 protein [Candidatus Acidoferrales bacterium]